VKTTRALTLVEMMLVVAVVSLLAAIAIPNFSAMQYRSRRAEVKANVAGIAHAQHSYHALYDAFVDAGSNPGSPLTKEPKAWILDEPGWTDLGYMPDGLVRCTYTTGVFGDGAWFRVTGTCDIDDDNSSAIVRFYSEEASSPGWVDVYPTRY